MCVQVELIQDVLDPSTYQRVLVASGGRRPHSWSVSWEPADPPFARVVDSLSEGLCQQFALYCAYLYACPCMLVARSCLCATVIKPKVIRC